MNEFDTVDELWFDAANKIKEGHSVDSRDGQSQETLGYVARLNNPRANFMFNPVRKLSPYYAAAELLWYLSGTDNIEMIKAYAPQYTRFTEDGEHTWGAYGNRWLRDEKFKTELFRTVHEGRVQLNHDDFFRNQGKRDEFICPLTQLQVLVWLLKKNPLSRQGVITAWNAGDLPHALAGDKKDLPCTLSLNFIIRNEKLYLHVTMRSNDIWLGLPYDIWCFTCIQQLVAEALNLELGWYQHSAMSMHVYSRDYEKFIAALRTKTFMSGSLQYKKHRISIRDAIPVAIKLENFVRTKMKMYTVEFEQLGEESLLHQCLTMISLKWRKTNKEYYHVSNPLMKNYVRKLYNVDN